MKERQRDRGIDRKIDRKSERKTERDQCNVKSKGNWIMIIIQDDVDQSISMMK